MANLGSAKPMTGGRDKIYLSDEADLVDFSDGEWHTLRIVGPFSSYAQQWFQVWKKDGTKSKAFPKIVIDYDPKTQEFGDFCPYRNSGVGNTAQKFIMNVIDRYLQENPPRKVIKPNEKERKLRRLVSNDDFRARVKQRGSKTTTPMRLVDLPSSAVEKIINLKALNKRKGKTYEVSDPRFGRDIMIKYNAKAAGAAKWEVQLGERTKLTKEELLYCMYPLEGYKSIEPEPRKIAEKEAKGIVERFAGRDDKKPKKVKSKFDDDDDDDDDDDNDEEDDDDDEDDDEPKKKPKKKKNKAKSKKSSKKKTKSSRDDDDFDDDDDEFDDDDD